MKNGLLWKICSCGLIKNKKEFIRLRSRIRKLDDSDSGSDEENHQEEPRRHDSDEFKRSNSHKFKDASTVMPLNESQMELKLSHMSIERTRIHDNTNEIVM